MSPNRVHQLLLAHRQLKKVAAHREAAKFKDGKGHLRAKLIRVARALGRD
jgi:hypothetical protein